MADLQIREFPLVDSPLGTDFAHIYNTDNATNKKILVKNLVSVIGASTRIVVDTFRNGIEFTEDVTTELTLTTTPASEKALLVFFDGLLKYSSYFSVDGNVLTFVDPIPEGVKVVEILTPLAIPSGTVFADNIVFPNGSTYSWPATDGSDGHYLVKEGKNITWKSMEELFKFNRKDISGSDGGNTAVDSLAAGLESLGLVNDNTTSP